MSVPAVNLITAFGRGETLALALVEQGFTVRVLDFTSAFPSEYARGPGPFPIAWHEYLPEQKDFLNEVIPLERGVTFWLPEGPLELNGPMAPFFKSTRKDFQALAADTNEREFKVDWLRRFLRQWASPFQNESWAVTVSGSIFPWTQAVGLIPSYDEVSVMSFDRLNKKTRALVSCQRVSEIRMDGSRLSEIVVEAGQQSVAYAAEQWVWCLSSRETEILNAPLAKRIFTKGIWRPDWVWMSFAAGCEHGPWSDGFPQHAVVVGDVCLPWLYANVAVLRRLDPEGFRVWMKIPAKSVNDEGARERWSSDIQQLLNERLPLARWNINADRWAICPNSPVFDSSHREWGAPAWKNWDWIAPERLERLDFSARLEREAKSFERLMQWKNDQLKKQGALNRDQTLHAP